MRKKSRISSLKIKTYYFVMGGKSERWAAAKRVQLKDLHKNSLDKKKKSVRLLNDRNSVRMIFCPFLSFLPAQVALRLPSNNKKRGDAWTQIRCSWSAPLGARRTVTKFFLNCQRYGNFKPAGVSFFIRLLWCGDANICFLCAHIRDFIDFNQLTWWRLWIGLSINGNLNSRMFNQNIS